MRFTVALLALLAFASPASAGHGGQHIFVKINGLVCDFCARSMEKVFLKREPVSSIKVDLTSKIVTIDLKKDALLSDDDITKGVTDAGYSIVEIKRD